MRASNRCAITAVLCVGVALMLVAMAAALPSNGTYSIESRSRRPGCASTIMAPLDSCSSVELSGLVKERLVGWRFEKVPGTSNIYNIYSVGCKRYLCAQGCSGNLRMMDSNALKGAVGIQQQWHLAPTGDANEYTFKTVGRGGCSAWMSAKDCDRSNALDKWGTEPADTDVGAIGLRGMADAKPLRLPGSDQAFLVTARKS